MLATRRSQNHTTTQAGKDLKNHRVQQLIQHSQAHHYTQLIHGEACISGCCGCPTPEVSQGQFGQGLEPPGLVPPKVSLPLAGGVELNNLYIPSQPKPLSDFPPSSKLSSQFWAQSIRFCFGLYPCLGLRQSSQGHALQGMWHLEGALWGATTSICPFQAVLLQHPAFLLLLTLRGSLCSPQAAGAQQG